MVVMSDGTARTATAAESGLEFDRAGLAERADVPPFVVDLVIDAGLLVPLNGDRDDERFGSEDVEMLAAARTLVGEGVAVEELAALAMRHATHVEGLIDDAIDLLKRHADRSGNGASLDATVQRLVPVATQLVVGHFERTLWARAMDRLGGARAAAGTIVVSARRLPHRVDPLAAYAAADARRQRSVWLRPDAGMGLAAIGTVEAIEPVGADRFSGASAARAVLAARVRRHGPGDAPAPVLVGGFAFGPGDPDGPDPGNGKGMLGDGIDALGGGIPSDPAGPGIDALDGGSLGDPNGPVIPGAAGDRGGPKGIAARHGPKWDGFGDSRLVLPELTVIDRPDGTWVQAATRVGPDGDEAAAEAELEERLASFSVEPLATGVTGISGPGFDPRDSDRPGVDRDGVNRPGADRDGADRPAAADGEGDRLGAAAGYDADDDYLDHVASAVEAIGRGDFQKVVLARTVTLDADVDAVAVLDRLRRRNPTCSAFAFSVGSSTFLGATPEELVTLNGPWLHTTALAGTAPRGDSPDADERLGTGLLASAKNRSEHRFVVDGITEALAGLGLVDPAPAQPGLLRLSRLQHLRTPITARVQRRRSGASDMDVLRAVGVLHPTAATGGAPTDAALRFIAAREDFDRGWYAAPVGWCDLEGNGEIGVALRSALIEHGRIHLFAGAGIVADSEPADELEETSVKLRALLDVIHDLASGAPPAAGR